MKMYALPKPLTPINSWHHYSVMNVQSVFKKILTTLWEYFYDIQGLTEKFIEWPSKVYFSTVPFVVHTSSISVAVLRFSDQKSHQL